MTNETKYYVTIGTRTVGPVSAKQVLDGIRAGKIISDSSACRVGDEQWGPISTIDPFTSEFPQQDAKPPIERTHVMLVSDALPADLPPPPARDIALVSPPLVAHSTARIVAGLLALSGILGICLMCGVGVALNQSATGSAPVALVPPSPTSPGPVVAPTPPRCPAIEDFMIGQWRTPSRTTEDVLIFAFSGRNRVTSRTLEPGLLMGAYRVTPSSPRTFALMMAFGAEGDVDGSVINGNILDCDHVAFETTNGRVEREEWTRVGPAPPFPTSAALIVGTWRFVADGRVHIEAFDANPSTHGSYMLDGEFGTYAISGGPVPHSQLTTLLNGQRGSWRVAFTSSEHMSIGPYRYTRVGDNPFAPRMVDPVSGTGERRDPANQVPVGAEPETAVQLEHPSCIWRIHDRRPPTRVRQSPGNTDISLAELDNGTAINIVSRDGRWAQIDQPVAGWVFEANISCD